MRARQRLAPFAACAAVLCIAGCGASGAQSTPKVNLSITAPISGATVGVQRIVVAGKVVPATAAVVVGGQPAQVAHGSFTHSLSLAQPTETITVSAQATGYAPSSASTTVQYSSQIAAQLAAAKAAQAKALTVASVPTTKAPNRATRAANSKAVGSAFALQSPASTTTTHKTSSASPKSTSKTTPGSTSKTKRKSSTRATHKSALKLARQTVAKIKKLWIKGCVKAGKGQKYGPYCRCTYTHLERKGWLRSRARLLALDKKLKRYDRTHNPADLPRFVRAAISACVAKLPPPKNTAGGLGNHQAATLRPQPNPSPVLPVRP